MIVDHQWTMPYFSECQQYMFIQNEMDRPEPTSPRNGQLPLKNGEVEYKGRVK